MLPYPCRLPGHTPEGSRMPDLITADRQLLENPDHVTSTSVSR